MIHSCLVWVKCMCEWCIGCDTWWYCVCEDGRTGGRKEGGRSGYSTKNKNPTRQCGECGKKRVNPKTNDYINSVSENRVALNPRAESLKLHSPCWHGHSLWITHDNALILDKTTCQPPWNVSVPLGGSNCDHNRMQIGPFLQMNVLLPSFTRTKRWLYELYEIIWVFYNHTITYNH